MYTVGHYFYDNCELRSARWSMRKYKSLRAATAKADSVKGGYVCRYGSNEILHLGEWLLS